MIRLPHTTMRAALTTVAVAAGALLAPAALPGSAHARSDNLAKPVIIVAGPEVPSGCKATAKLRSRIQRFRPEVEGTEQRFTGSLHLVNINPSGVPCGEADATQISASALDQAAADLSKVIAEQNTASKGAVDVIALGSGGPVLRYALLMAERKRAGLRMFGEARFEANLDVEDAVAVGGLMAGTTTVYSKNCRPATFCDDLKKPANVADPKPIQWQLMDGSDYDAQNPQGINGTDWSLIALTGERYAPVESALGMDAAHKTIYEDPALDLEDALQDDVNALNAKIRFLHAPATEFSFSAKGAHVVGRIAQDIVWGSSVDEKAGDGPAFAKGCVGYNDDSTGATVVIKPQFLGWKGDERAVRTLRFGQVDAVADCFKLIAKDTYSVRGPAWVRVNGLDFHLAADDSSLFFDVKKRRMYLVGERADVQIPRTADSSLDLWTFEKDDRFPLDWKFPATDGPVQTDDGTTFALQAPKLKILGLEVQGAVSMKVEKGAFQLDLSVALPGIFSSDLTGSTSGKQECGNGKDDDDDGKIDAADTDCDGKTTGDFEDRDKASGIGVTVGTRNTTGLQFDKFSGEVGGAIAFGPFRSEGGIKVSYSRPTSELAIEVEAKFPAFSDVGVKLKVGLKNGNLSSIYGELNGFEVPLWSTGLFLQKFGVGASGIDSGKQLEILVAAGFSLLRKIDGVKIAEIDGEVTTSVTAPWKFTMKGEFDVVNTQVGTASFEYEQGTGAKIGMTLGREWGFLKDPVTGEPHFSIVPQGTISGSMSNFGEIDFGGAVQACIKGKVGWQEYEEPKCLGASQMRFTRFKGQPVTQAFCFKTSLLGDSDWSVGFVTRYGEQDGHFHSTVDWIAKSCDVADYGAKPSQAVGEAPTDRFTIRPGVDRQVVTLHGPAESQTPNATLIAPDGTRIATPTDAIAGKVGDRAFVMSGMGDQTVFALEKPQPGQWRVELSPGSPKVTKIDVLSVLPEPEVSATISRDRRSGALVLHHEVKEEPGQEVRFVERAGGVLHELARSTGGKGRTRFTPAFGPGGRREVVAVVMQDGRVRREVPVSSFDAPAPALPARPSNVRIKRTGQTVVVTWARAAHAGKYEVLVRLPNGRTQAQIVKTRRVVVRGLDIPGVIEARVRGLRIEDEGRGPAATVRSTGLTRPARAKHHRR